MESMDYDDEVNDPPAESIPFEHIPMHDITFDNPSAESATVEHVPLPERFEDMLLVEDDTLLNQSFEAFQNGLRDRAQSNVKRLEDLKIKLNTELEALRHMIATLEADLISRRATLAAAKTLKDARYASEGAEIMIGNSTQELTKHAADLGGPTAFFVSEKRKEYMSWQRQSQLSGLTENVVKGSSSPVDATLRLLEKGKHDLKNLAKKINAVNKFLTALKSM